MLVDGVERKDCLVHLRDDVEFLSPDQLFMKGMIMDKAGITVGQHAHEYGHTSLLARGRCRVIMEGDTEGTEYMEGDTEGTEYVAPAFIWVPAKIKHLFVSLEADTHVYCIHNMSNQEGSPLPSVFAEHNLPDGGV